MTFRYKYQNYQNQRSTLHETEVFPLRFETENHQTIFHPRVPPFGFPFVENTPEYSFPNIEKYITN